MQQRGEGLMSATRVTRIHKNEDVEAEIPQCSVLFCFLRSVKVWTQTCQTGKILKKKKPATCQKISVLPHCI